MQRPWENLKYLNESERFKRAVANEDFALNFYRNHRADFESLPLDQRQKIVKTHFALLRAMISNPELREQDVVVLCTEPQSSEPCNHAPIQLNVYAQLKKAGELLSHSLPMFERLDPGLKCKFACHNINLARTLLSEKQLEKYNTYDLSSMVSAYAWPSFDSCRQENDQICVEFANDQVLLKRINPATKMLLFSRIRQIKETLPTLQPSDLPLDVRREINTAYTLPLDDTICFWITAIASIDGPDYVGRFHEVLANAKGTWWRGQPYTGLNRTATPSETLCAEALAMILIQDPRFIAGFQSENSPVIWAQLTTADRVELGILYPNVAYTLLMNKNYQGLRGLSKEECDLLKQTHGHLEYIKEAAEFRKSLIKAENNCPQETEMSLLFDRKKRLEGREVFNSSVPSLKTLGMFAAIRANLTTSTLPQELQQHKRDVDEFKAEEKFVSLI